MTPAPRGGVCVLLLVVVAAAATVALLYGLGPSLGRSPIAPIALVLMSLLTGAAIAICVESFSLRPVERYRRQHRRLAGPRPGARLG